MLDSLRPGMVYVGGTDYGRWVPTLLSETSGREPHIIVTQNALADGRYVEYMNTLCGDRFAALTEEDSQRAFREYVTDAQRRLEHDLEFPDEPSQLRFGEEVKLVDGKVQVGGQVAVMSINEKLLQALLAKNPDLDFAVQESSPLRGTYADASPLGPLMELGARDELYAFTPERAAQSLDYWRTMAQQVFSDPEALNSTYALKSYSHNTVSAANLLAAHNFTAEAEEAYRLAAQLWPGNANLSEVSPTCWRPAGAKLRHARSWENSTGTIQISGKTWNESAPQPASLAWRSRQHLEQRSRNLRDEIASFACNAGAGNEVQDIAAGQGIDSAISRPASE